MARGRLQEAREPLDAITEEMGKRRRGPMPEFELPTDLARARMERMLGDLDAARDAAHRAKLRARTGDECGAVLTELGLLAKASGSLHEARRAFVDAMENFARSGADRGSATAAAHLGNVLRALAQPEEARKRYDRALEIHRSLGDKPHLAAVLSNLGSLQLDMDDLDAAKISFEESLEEFLTIGDERNTAITHGNLGRLHQMQGDFRTAATDYRRATLFLKEIGDRRFAALFRGNEGSLHHESGRLDEAEAAYREALDVVKRIGDKRFYAIFQGRLGALLADAGRLKESADLLAAARKSVPEGDPLTEAAAAAHRAHLPLAKAMKSGDNGVETLKEAARVYWTTMGREDAPGPARMSGDVRIAARLLARQIQEAKKRFGG
jgi:tetratricopeptide (TPR) repeat protein